MCIHAVCWLQEGDLGDSRKRRAAVDAAQNGSAEEESESSEDGESDSDVDEAPAKAEKLVRNSGDELSDDEAMATLQRYQQQKLLEASQVQR